MERLYLQGPTHYIVAGFQEMVRFKYAIKFNIFIAFGQ